MTSHNLTPNQFRVVRELVEAHRAGHTGELFLHNVMGVATTVQIEGSEREVPAEKFDLLALERAGFVILEDRRGDLFAQLQQAAFEAVDEVAGAASMSIDESRFSRRHGYGPGDVEIAIREDAPESLRVKLLVEARAAGVSGTTLYRMLAGLMGRKPYLPDWSDVWFDTQQFLGEADWPVVYDFAEFIGKHLQQNDPVQVPTFEATINTHLREAGIGWQMIDGEVQTRGTEVFEATVRTAKAKLAVVGLPRASDELRKALDDLSKRPEPDLTGALHHALGALESVAREACGNSTLTLGGIVKQHSMLFPSALVPVVEKVWGYASEEGRHIREGGEPDRTDVELVVGLSATLATYLAAKLK